jgi:hypothetical protein
MGSILSDNRASRNTSDFKIFYLRDVNNFIELFKPVKLLGAKALDYKDFCVIINLINNKAHLTQAGLDQIRTICRGMNSRRVDFKS